MKSNILIVYQFATFGGVERVLLNRAEAFKYYNLKYKLYIYFYNDYGAKASLKSYINKEKLEDYIEIVDHLNLKKYDKIISIDTPQILTEHNIHIKDIIIETHTFEKKYRKYLDEYIKKNQTIIVPSNLFKKQLEKEYNLKLDNNIKVLNNFVPWDIKKDKINKTISLPEWNKKIIFYFGRIDENKNVKEIIRAVKYYNEKYKNNLILVTIGKSDPNYNIEKYIENEQMNNKVVMLPPINFNAIPILLNTMKKSKAIFISASKGETFSLSSAETISHDIPVILSDIDAHTSLVKNNEKFLYNLGDIENMAKKIDYCIKNYDKLSEDIKEYKNDFSAKKFVNEWDKLIEGVNHE